MYNSDVHVPFAVEEIFLYASEVQHRLANGLVLRTPNHNCLVYCLRCLGT